MTPEFLSAAEWIVGMPGRMTYAEQSDYMAQGLEEADRAGDDEDRATLRIFLANKLSLDRRDSEALAVLEGVRLTPPLTRGHLPGMLAEAFLQAGDATRGLGMVFLGYEAKDPKPALPSEFEEYKGRRVRAVGIAARCGVERLGEQLRGMSEDMDEGYVFQADRYPVTEEDLARAMEGTSIGEAVRRVVLPYDAGA